MGKAVYVQRGESLDYLNTTDETIEAGTVIELETLVGVAGTDIPAGQLGSVHVTGVFQIPKTDAAEIPMGTEVYYDGTGITTASGTTLAGYAAADAAAADAVVSVKLRG